MEEKYILAIEIGSSSIKGAVGTLDEDGLLKVIAIEVEKQVESVRHGLVINVENVSKRINSIIRKLENRVSPHKAQSVYLGIGGRSFCSSPRSIERRLPIEDMITDSLVRQLRAEALSTALSNREVVDVVDSAYYINNQQLNDPVGTYGRDIKARFNLITCRLQIKRNLIRAIEDRLHLKINGMIVRQLAEGELVLSSDLRRKGCMLVDFGAETTTVSIYKHGGLLYLNTIPLGSRNITRDIMALNHLEETAEELKLAGGDAMPSVTAGKQVIDGIDFTDINAYVAARSIEIAANINEQLAFADITAAELPGGIVMIGGGGKLKGFSQLLQKITKMNVVAGMLNTVRIADAHASAYESIDVISILAAASRLPEVVNCMTRPEPIFTPAPEPVTTSTPVSAPVTETPVNVTPEPAYVEEPEEEAATPASIFKNDEEDDPEVYIPKRRGRTLGSFFKNVIRNVENIMSEEDDDDDSGTTRR